MFCLSRVYQRISFRSKLVFSFLLVVFVPIIFVCIFIYGNTISLNAREARVLIEGRLGREAAAIQAELDTAMAGARQVATSAILNRWFSQRSQSDVDYILGSLNTIAPVLTLLRERMPAASRLSFFTTNPHLAEVLDTYQVSRVRTQPWYAPAQRRLAEESYIWEAFHPVREYATGGTGILSSFSLFGTLPFLAPSDATFFEIELAPERLFRSLSSGAFEQPGALLVCDGEGRLLFGGPDDIDRSLLEDAGIRRLLGSGSAEAVVRVHGTSYQLNRVVLPHIDANLVSVVRTADLRGPITGTWVVFIVAIVALLATLVLLAVLLATLLFKRIQMMLEAIRKIQQQDFDVQIPVKGSDEIDELAADINAMSRTIKDLINTVYKTRLAQREAELIALHSQINPHFIYNILETFRMMAELGDQEPIAQGLAALGNLLRYNTASGIRLIELPRELALIEDYLRIQNLLANGRIRSRIDVDEGLGDYRVPNLVLQPIVENAVVHGMSEETGELCIDVVIRREGEEVVIRVSDDGAGIPPERLERVRSSIATPPVSPGTFVASGGIALANINERIRLYHGSRYGLSIRNGDPGGTEVTVRLPFTFSLDRRLLATG